MIDFLRRVRRKGRYLKMLMRMYLEAMSHENVIVHIGHFSNDNCAHGNVGDPVLFAELEHLVDKLSGKNHYWLRRYITCHEVCRIEVWLYNHFTSGILIGGHGLLMIDTGKNPNSGWQFNINVSNLKRIRVPMAIMAIGYNTFRGQPDFIKVFREHINLCISKCRVFGLRNYGSINALMPYVEEANKPNVKFQPCPTTMLSLYEDLPHVEKTNEIGVCLAFDRYENRFGGHFDRAFNDLMAFSHEYEAKGYKVIFYAHTQVDLLHPNCERFNDNGYIVETICDLPFKDVFAWYLGKKLIIGMRGHSLMIPWGLRTPVVSLTTQNKQKWFIETTGHGERSIEVADPDMLNKLRRQVEYILSNYDEVVEEIAKTQKEFYEISAQNVKKLTGGGKCLIFNWLRINSTRNAAYAFLRNEEMEVAA